MVCDRPVCDWRFPAVVGVDAACFQQVVQVFQWSPSRCQFWSLACARLCSRVSSTGHVIGKLERPLARPRREAHEAIQHARGWPRCHAQPRSRRSDDQNLDSRADQDKTNTRYRPGAALLLPAPNLAEGHRQLCMASPGAAVPSGWQVRPERQRVNGVWQDVNAFVSRTGRKLKSMDDVHHHLKVSERGRWRERAGVRERVAAGREVGVRAHTTGPRARCRAHCRTRARRTRDARRA